MQVIKHCTYTKENKNKNLYISLSQKFTEFEVVQKIIRKKNNSTGQKYRRVQKHAHQIN